MSTTPASLLALALIALVTVATLVVGSLGTRVARSTDDFLAASRTVGSRANAAAISGQYLSAGAVLGVAGLVLSDGVDALWYPIGFAGGFLVLLLFVAAPLRRSGAYTVPDFAEARLDSAAVRRVTTWFVVAICWLYLLPQLQASGLALTAITGLPEWVGVVAVGFVVTAAVTFGGMRSMTFVQAFGFWIKITALAVPALVLLVWLVVGPGGGSAPFAAGAPAPPTFPAPTSVDVRTPVALDVAVGVDVTARGTVDGRPVDGPLRLDAGRHDVGGGAALAFPAGAPVPVVAGVAADDYSWARPFADPAGEGPTALGVYSLLLALLLGTLGLPHVLVRYYTNPDGRAARRTTVLVLGLLGFFFVLPPLLGVLSRAFVPQLLVTGTSDAAVLLLPAATLGGAAGTVLGAVVAAGAFAAFLSVSAGLVLTVAGVFSHDLLPGRLGDFRIAAHVAGVVPVVVALLAVRMPLAQTVSLAFVVAASSFAPLLILGIWWRRLTDRGALAGVLAGGGTALAAALASIFGAHLDGWVGVLLAAPALVTVPLAVVTMVLVSRSTSERIPPHVARTMLRLHAPERLGLGELRRPSG